MKKITKILGLLVFLALIIVTIYNVHGWIVSGEQLIKIGKPSKAYANSDLYLSIVAQKNSIDLDTETKVKLLDSNEKVVKDVNVKYEGNNVVLSVPDIEPGNYFIEAKVSSSAGKDTVKESIYISDDKSENVIITLDKGIYKPGDTVNYRALLINKDNDEPISEELNVSIYDGNNNKVYNENVKSSDYGITSGSFSLASEVNSGLYSIIVKAKNNETTKQFKVNPYILPKYEVNIEYDKDNYLVGDTANITFDAKYFFGEPAQNAKLDVFVNNKRYETLQTDNQGLAKMSYKIDLANTYNIKVEAVDSSNYYVEATSSFTAGTDIFEVQLLPEYGTLVAGRNNNVYVFTNKVDGTPLKTYVTVTSDNFTKQIATNENGIGKFSIDVENVFSNNNNYYYDDLQNTKRFSIEVENMSGEKINKSFILDIERRDLLVSTDKVKYNQGEDIKVNILSINENNKRIYFFKNDKLLKMISTESADTTVNLDDAYGLIDIYVTQKTGSSDYYYYSGNANRFKRTIFIKPAKQLGINISTDKEEYKPGENISISFDAVNENKQGVDTALLVSMLDNSVLNLASNDLSIDNIKLSLQDINFTNDLDAATLYSCVVNDESEQTMMALLLKQSDKDIRVSESAKYNSEQEDEYAKIAIISIICIVFIVILFLCIKHKKIRIIMQHVFNFIIFDFLFMMIVEFITQDYYWRSGHILGLSLIAGLTIYVLFAKKIYKVMHRTSISILITILLITLFSFLIAKFKISSFAIVVTILVIALLLGILAIIFGGSKESKVRKEIIYIFKFIGACAVALLIGIILEAIPSLDEEIIVPLTLIWLYPLNYYFNGLKKKFSDDDIESNRKNSTAVIIFASIGVIAAISFVFLVLIYIFTSANSLTNDAVSQIDYSMSSRMYEESMGLDAINPSIGGLSADSSSKASSIVDGIGNIFSSGKNESNTTVNKTATEQTEIVKDENVRNVFLESMCFIPELIATNGRAKLDMRLSDNITTWTIQTVGNTKDGRIGYETLNNVKVFKDFFVDFELPKNLIETDKVSIPVTVYNYTDKPITTTLNIKQDDWFSLGNSSINVNVDAKATRMVYVPITVLKAGNNKFRTEVSSDSLTDIVEKECVVSSKGYKVEKVVSTGSLDGDITEDILFLDDFVENTPKAKVKIYANTISQAVEGMENIFRMPTGCFEQISSSLYPNILALKYLEDNNIVNEEIRKRALSYISSGYQKILTYEVRGESGGYSLYGDSPAETVLTAYGLMEFSDLSKVYDVDDAVIRKMNDFLYKKQNSNGSFTITGHHSGGAGSSETLAQNAYITWALSESNPNDDRLNKSVEYLKSKLNSINDNYTLALIANILANVKDNELNNVIKRLVNSVTITDNGAYITSEIRDYYGSYAHVQSTQTVALTSMALSKASYSPETNKLLLNYLISKKDYYGTWYNTQATILALKALNESNQKRKLENQTIKVKVNSDEKRIEIKDNPLELYELTFDNLRKENKLSIDMESGTAYYEVTEEYYIPYEKVNTKEDKIEITVESNNTLKVNEILKPNIKVINRSGNEIYNGMVTIAIPQGFTVAEETLMELESKGIIEKYEMSYTAVNIYLRNFEEGQIVNLDVGFRASYPVDITGMAVRAYDYYNPSVEGRTMPIKITVK